MRLIVADYLYNKLVANKCPYDLVLQMVKDEPTVDVFDKIRAEIEQCKGNFNTTSSDTCFDIVLQIIDKYKEDKE